MRAVIFGVAVCLASWLALAFAAGNVGLQRSVSIGPATLIVERPLAVLLLLAAAFVVAYGLSRAWRVERQFAVTGVLAVVAGDLLGSAVLAPLAVGELEIAHAPVVFVVISFFGTQIVAAAAGVLVGARRQAG